MDNENLNEDELLDDVEENNVEEGHDAMNAEPKSVDSVRKAGATGPKAKKRHADKDKKENGGKAYKPNKGIVRELYAKMDEMDGDTLRALHDMIMDENFTAESLESVEEDDQLEDVTYDMSEDVSELVESEATLSEGFKDKAATIMEMAVKSKVKAEIAQLEEAYNEQFDEALTEAKEDMVEKVDSYLNYVVENWMEENKLAVQTGLRTEIAENFMNGMKDLFTESYIEVPESKVDLVDDLAEQVETLEEENNKLVEKVMADAEELESFRRERAIFEMSDDLTDTQVDKFAKLSENVDFEDEEQFADALATIKETYFGKKSANPQQTTISEDVDLEDEEVEVTGSMAKYVEAIRKSKKF